MFLAVSPILQVCRREFSLVSLSLVSLVSLVKLSDLYIDWRTVESYEKTLGYISTLDNSPRQDSLLGVDRLL